MTCNDRVYDSVRTNAFWRLHLSTTAFADDRCQANFLAAVAVELIHNVHAAQPGVSKAAQEAT